MVGSRRGYGKLKKQGGVSQVSGVLGAWGVATQLVVMAEKTPGGGSFLSRTKKERPTHSQNAQIIFPFNGLKRERLRELG